MIQNTFNFHFCYNFEFSFVNMMYQQPQTKQNLVDLEYVCPFIKDPNPSTHLIEKLRDPVQSMNIDQPVVNILLFF